MKIKIFIKVFVLRNRYIENTLLILICLYLWQKIIIHITCEEVFSFSRELLEVFPGAFTKYFISCLYRGIGSAKEINKEILKRITNMFASHQKYDYPYPNSMQ